MSIAPRYGWVDANGTEYTLSDPLFDWASPRDAVIVQGRDGFMAPSQSFAEYVVPGVPGTQLRQATVGARDLTLVLRLLSDSVPAVRVLARKWVSRFTLGPGELRIYDSDIGNRFIPCMYAGGMEGAETPDVARGAMRSVILALRAFSPYFTDGHPVRLDFAPTAPAPFFPFLPLTLSAGLAAQSNIAVNVGDVPAYPVWTFTGPGGPITVTNATTGDTFTWSGTLNDAQTLTVDTRPSNLTVRLGDGTSGYGSFGGDMWWLPPGSHTLNVNMLNATGASQASLTYDTLYASA